MNSYCSYEMNMWNQRPEQMNVGGNQSSQYLNVTQTAYSYGGYYDQQLNGYPVNSLNFSQNTQFK